MPDIAIAGNVTGPMTKASVLMGMESFAIALEAEHWYVDEVMDLGLENTKCVLERFEKDSSADFIFLASASDNPDLFGPAAYEEYCIKRLGHMVDMSGKHGFPVAFHPHEDFTGPFGALLPKTISTSISGFQFSEGNEPSAMAFEIGDSCALMGGTDVVPTLYTRELGEIESETRRYMANCMGPRYVFMLTAHGNPFGGGGRHGFRCQALLS